MTWFIVFFMANIEPFAMKGKTFETRDECIVYVNNPSNASTLAIEVIAIAGFNDTITAIACLPENEIPKHEKSSI